MIKWSNDWQQHLPNKKRKIYIKSPYLNKLKTAKNKMKFYRYFLNYYDQKHHCGKNGQMTGKQTKTLKLK